MLDRLAHRLFLLTLFLLPWGGLLRVPTLHENAQWSDLVFASAAACWLAARLRERRLPRPRPVHGLLALYLGWAALSLALASPQPAPGLAKLVGVAMLLGLFVATSETMARPGGPAAVGRTIAAASLLTALAAVAGVALSAAGVTTPLVGTCGDLLPGPLGRAQAGFPHPNLLASFCLFAYGVVTRADAGLRPWLRALAQGAIGLTLLLTTSRAILAFLLLLAIRGATSAPRRRLAQALAAVLLVAFAALSVYNVVLNPARPWEARVSARPSPRLLALATSLDTLAAHPLFGTGPGSSPGLRGSLPFDAHFTPLNVAATLGLPALAGLGLAVVALWRARGRPSDLVTWGMLAGLGLDGVAQDVEDFRHMWLALGLADAGRDRTGEAA